MSNSSDFVIKGGILEKYKGNESDVTIPDSVTTIGGGAFAKCENLTSITIPDGVTTIGEEAFAKCENLTSVNIPDSVTTIGTCAFAMCENLTSITIPDSVTTIGMGAFAKCENLTSVTIPDSVTTIVEKAFLECRSLKSITIPDSVTTIGDYAFLDCRSLKSITIPDSVTTIDSGAFSGCKNLTSVNIPDGVTTIGYRAFSECKNLTSITIPDSVTTIGDDAFSECENLTSIAIPDSVTTIGDGAFSGCKNLTSITIPDSVTTIGDDAFSECENLTSIAIPDSVTTIGDGAFSGCKSLKSITIPCSDCKTGKKLFGDHLPKELVSCVKDLYMHFTDGDLKRYVLDKSVWSKLDSDLQTEIFIARNSKLLIPCYAEEFRDPDLLGKKILVRISEEASVEECNAAASFLTAFGEIGVSVELARRIYNALKPLKNAKKALKIIKANEILCSKLNEESETNLLVGSSRDAADILQSENKTVVSVAAALKKYYSLKFSDLPKLCFIDGTQAPEWVIAYLLSVHEDMDGDRNIVIPTYEKPGICENAQKMLALLDPASFQAALLTIADSYLGLSGNSKKMYLAYPVCRYAGDDTMNELVKRAPKWRSRVSGNDAPPLRTFRKACIYSNCRSAIMFADKYGDLDEYAAIRNTDAQIIRDTVLADFGFDAEGKKMYDLGGTTIVVTLEKDCKPSLFNTKAGKVVKSIPKRGNDEALVAAASKDFSELKKNVKKVIKNRFAQLFSNFINGTEQKAKNWTEAYINNPLLRTAANIIVWQQEKKTFILKDDKAIYADGTPYNITNSPISVAHPMEMTQSEISAWQTYFLEHSLKQPFEQIWEPVIRPEEIHKDRYAGTPIPYFRFINQEKHGIFIENYDFHNEIVISFNECDVSIECLDRNGGNNHDISINDCFEVKTFSFKKYSRQVNHIVAYLDKATIYNRIVNDDASVVQYMKNLTLAQVTKFIEFAAQNNRPNVSAVLLEYKNDHFAQFDPMTEFTLEEW